MRKEMVSKGARIVAFATVMFTSATLFASQVEQIAPSAGGDGGALIQPINDNGGGFQILAGTDGTWIGNSAGTQLWSDTTKWSGGTVADGAGATANITFNITTVAGRNVTIDGAVASRTLAILNIGDTDASSPYALTGVNGGTLTFDNTPNSANAQLNESSGSAGDTISLPIVLTSSLDVTNGSSNTLTLSGVISSAGALNFSSSAGTLALGSSVNTYGGGTTISGGGKITIGASGTPLGSGTLTLGGGTLIATANRTAANALTNNIVVSADSAITTTSAAATNTQRFSGTLTGTGGTLTLRNDAAATTALFDVIFSGGDYTMSRPIILDNGAGGGTVRFSDFGASGTTHTYSGVISGNGAFNRSSASGAAGLTVFLADNTYTGATTITNSTLQLGNGGTTGSLSPSSAITINAGGTLRFDHTSGSNFVQGTNFSSSAITGAGAIIKEGTCTLTFNVANTFSGGLTINKGAVVSAVDGALGTGNVSLTAGSITLTLNGASNNIADTKTLSYVNTDTINLNNTTTDTVAGLVVDGVSQAPGVYGASFTNPDGAFFGVGTITVVPEPTTIGMLLLGGGLLSAVQRFRRKQS